MKELKINKVRVVFTIEQNKDFSVTVEGWNDVGFRNGDYENLIEKWNWNVYAHIYESHPFFNDVDSALELPLHWGATYDQIITHEPAQGIKYDLQKITKCLKVGSDYAHCDDDYDNHPSAFDGVPFLIDSDAKRLVKALEKALEKDNEL
jgi:hypothetical protein